MNDSIDFAEIKENRNTMTISELRQWAKENFDLFLESVIRQLQFRVPSSIGEYGDPSTHFCSPLIHEQMKRFIKKDVDPSSQQFPLLSCVAYAGTEFECSCQEICFGTNEYMELYGQDRAFLDRFGDCSGELQSEILCLLDTNQEPVDNPLFIFRRRVDNFAASLGQSLEVFLVPIFSALNRGRPVDDFVYNETPAIMRSGRSVYRHNRAMFFPLLWMYMLDNVTADYLLLHDYSGRAMYQSKELTSEQKNALSKFLLATPEAQINVLTLMLHKKYFSI